ncbi:MAG TPA: protein kinase, partial [Polyangiales bacterium]|nr:protein kinase [Polyangiales bacterium]
MTTVKAQDLVGQTVLGRYRIVRRLARGGMGAVYLGRTEGAAGFARPVVIKRVLPSLMDDDEVAQMFVREAQVLSNLQHPNIVTVLDFGQQADGAYLMVLEYVHGFQLAQWSEYVQKTRGLLPVDFALYIVTRVLDALHYAHTFRRGDGKAMQIIHRDVSPSNVLLNAQADVKLLDFGIARVSGDETAFVTDRSQVKGKLPYLPLESFKGADPSVQSDVYSAGVMLYELLTGTNPFLGRETAEIYAKILEVVPKSVHASRDDAPEDIDAVLGKAMHKDAAQRYASAADFASALRALRSKPEEVLASTLAAALTQDFERALPELLKVETLAVRESAWRNPTETPKTDEIDELLLPQSRPDAGPEQVTVRAPIDRALIAATVVNTPAPAAPPAVTVRPGPPPVAPPPAAIVAPKPVAPAQASAPQPTAAATSPLPASPSPTPEAPAASTKRIGVVAALASAIGAAVVVGVWFAVQPNAQEQQVVVIRQEA